MSLLTGPGRNSEMSTMRSSKVLGANLPTSSRWPGDSIWKQPRVWVDCTSAKVAGSSRGTAVDVDHGAVDPLDLLHRVRHGRLHADAEHVELEQPELLDVVLVELAHREAQPAGLDRCAVEQGGVGQQHPARVERDVAGQPVEPLDHAQHQVDPGGVVAADRPLARSSGRSRIAARTWLARMCGNALASASISPGGMPRAGPDVADAVARR
jgi:hypothetical protein